MGGPRHVAAGLAAAMVLALVPAAPLTGATSDGCGDPGCHLTRQIGGDYWVGEFDLDETFTIRDGSRLEATLGFEDRTDRSGALFVLENLEDGSIPLGIVVWVKATRDKTEIYHEPVAGWDSYPVGDFEWDEEGITIRWNFDQDLDPERHRLVVAGPTADTLRLSVDFDSPNSTTLTAESSGSTGGALVVEDDWNPSTLVQFPGLKVLRDGQHSFTVPSDRRLYGYHGPATGGVGAVDACFILTGVCGAVVGGSGTNWGHSVFGLERPDGSSEQREFSWPACTFATCPAGPGPGSNSFVLLNESSGDWNFTVAEHEGLGAAPNMLGMTAPVELP